MESEEEGRWWSTRRTRRSSLINKESKETSFYVMDNWTRRPPLPDVINKETKEIASDGIRTPSQVWWGR